MEKIKTNSNDSDGYDSESEEKDYLSECPDDFGIYVIDKLKTNNFVDKLFMKYGGINGIVYNKIYKSPNNGYSLLLANNNDIKKAKIMIYIYKSICLDNKYVIKVVNNDSPKFFMYVKFDQDWMNKTFTRLIKLYEHIKNNNKLL